jgi:hypothetical protein
VSRENHGSYCGVATWGVCGKVPGWGRFQADRVGGTNPPGHGEPSEYPQTRTEPNLSPHSSDYWLHRWLECDRRNRSGKSAATMNRRMNSSGSESPWNDIQQSRGNCLALLEIVLKISHRGSRYSDNGKSRKILSSISLDCGGLRPVASALSHSKRLFRVTFASF